ncbi:unnamed protein product [Oppiella nova]|uniref:Uncharacterized protein n=1 Tax=Oppiella nova TaxID=334625 RepID=A0A7R9QA63_9ACAR|nr:unnamed protein product [Oppiella nova]CAG2160020.1 unnamed protein product [Oppiella nova]
MTDFTGKYKQTSSENFDALLKELGLPDEVVNRARSQTAEVEITKDGSVYTIKTVTTSRTWETKFELGKEFDTPRFGGKTAKSLVVADGNKLIETIKGEKELKIVREFNGNELRQTSTTGAVVAVATFAKQ